jgi:hypothetical protein
MALQLKGLSLRTGVVQSPMADCTDHAIPLVAPEQGHEFAIQEMVTQTKNQTADARDWPVMGTRDLSGRERGRLFMQLPTDAHEASRRPQGAALRSDGGPRFNEVAERSGISDVYNGRGIAVADYNHDGYLDLYIANQGAPSCFYVNQTGSWSTESPSPPRGFLRLRLVGRTDQGITVGDRVFASTADAVGARVTLETATGKQIREVQGGMGFASQSEHALHFGVPDVSAVERITIQWPSGRTQEFAGDAARALVNRHTCIVEGGDEVSSW